MKKYTNLLFIALIFTSHFSLALNDNKCSKMLNDGWFKKYKFGGIAPSVHKAITQETKSEGSTTATSNITTEGTTAVSDPGYTSNVMTSETQSSSSWGDCSLIALKLRQDQQIAYVEQNSITLEREISFGDGGHLDSLADFNFCETDSVAAFKIELKSNFTKINGLKSSVEKIKYIKQIIRSNSKLNKTCYSEFIQNT